MRAGFTVLNQEILSQQAIKGRSCLIVGGIIADVFLALGLAPSCPLSPERPSAFGRLPLGGKSVRDRDMRPGERILYFGESASCDLIGAASKVGLPLQGQTRGIAKTGAALDGTIVESICTARWCLRWQGLLRWHRANIASLRQLH
jgi:hypothetical protein